MLYLSNNNLSFTTKCIELVKFRHLPIESSFWMCIAL